METEAIAGAIGFGVFFAMWVLIPAVVQKRHASITTKEEKNE